MMDDAALYVIGPAGGPFKIGISRDIDGRLKSLQTGNPKRLTLWMAFDAGDAAREWEALMHSALAGHRLEGEWFDVDLFDLHRFMFGGSAGALCGGFYDNPAANDLGLAESAGPYRRGPDIALTPRPPRLPLSV